MMNMKEMITVPSPTRWNYYITDHLGSTRMVVSSNDSIRETINYYPFGSEMRMESPALLTESLGHPFHYIIITLIMFLVALSKVYGVEHLKIDSIVIKTAAWHITTPSNVSCSNFENDISYKECCISDSVIISKIVRELSRLELSNGKTLDVRCKIYFYSQGEIFTSACIDPNNVLYDGLLYKTSSSLKKTINRIEQKSKFKMPIRLSSYTKKEIPFTNGRDSLYNYLASALEDVVDTIERPVKLMVICQIDGKGNTTKVTIKEKKGIVLNSGYLELFSRLKEIFMKDIKWTPDKERYPFDVVTIPMFFPNTKATK